MKFKVLFKAPWTGGRWLQWSGGFETLQEAQTAINDRNQIDDLTIRVAVKDVPGCDGWLEVAV